MHQERTLLGVVASACSVKLTLDAHDQGLVYVDTFEDGAVKTSSMKSDSTDGEEGEWCTAEPRQV